jgi:xanthine dehydrogenase YagS FAD-binding subunit
MQASSAKEAASNASKGNAMVIAGGTDLLGTLKDEILPFYPSVIIDLKTIKGMQKIKEEKDTITIGALAKLADIADDKVVQSTCEALAKACSRAASPTIRNMGTIGGNICQMHRCWYFRAPNMRFECLRKGGKYCPARIGDNRYHSIYGNQHGCYAASSHDTAPALIALGATIVTTNREVPAEKFFEANGVRSNVLKDGEVVTEIKVPKSKKSSFEKFALRKSIDFPIVNCAAAYASDGSIRIALGGVYPAPLRITAAEEEVSKGVTEQAAAKAGDAAVASCKPLAHNAYKVEIARTLVKRTLLGLLD